MKKKGKVYIINVSLPPALLEEIDYWAKETSRKRSDFLREAARRYILIIRKEQA